RRASSRRWSRPRRSRSPATCAPTRSTRQSPSCTARSSSTRPRRNGPMPRVGVVAAPGAVGRVVVDVLRERGYDDVRLFASARSAGTEIDGRVVEEATPEILRAGGLDVCLFSVGTGASRELVPHAVRGGAGCVDNAAAFRLAEGVPLVVPEVNGERALEHDAILANPNCCTIPLTLVLKPLHEAAGLRAGRAPTYQAA